MSSTSLTPDEIRAAAETHHELGPEYQTAVIDSFLDKVGKEIDARVDARVGKVRSASPAQAAAKRHWKGSALALAIVSMSLGIPLTAIEAAYHDGLAGLAVIWGAIAIINVAYNKMASSDD